MLYSISNEFLTVTVRDLGAELQSILGADGTQYLWQGDPKYWGDRALNIFPYVARLTDGSYYLDGELQKMKIHGFASAEVFQVVEKTETRLVMELTDSEATYAQYPRHFSFRIAYELDGKTLKMVFRVENRDDKTMYYGIGGHPGFNVPLTENKKFEDYRLRFHTSGTPKRIGFTDACYRDGTDAPYALQDGTSIPLSHDLFDHDAIVLTDMSRAVTLEAPGDSHSVTVTYPHMDYLGIWHMPYTDAPYVCIEPWCSLPSMQDKIAVFEEQKDLHRLAPGGVEELPWEISIT